jgi:hypothetical protein
MPRNQSTAAQRARAAGGKYTEALRAEQEHQELGEPPVLVPITTTWCEPGCDGSPHAGASCKSWEPRWDSLVLDRLAATDRDSVSRAYAAYQAASLPNERVDSLTKRFLDEWPSSSAWLVGLVYAMLLEEQPELTPDVRELRAAVEAADVAGVDLLMQPLDRAAVALLDPEADHWWNTAHPRITAFAHRVVDDPDFELDFHDVTVLFRRQRTITLAQRWIAAQVERRNSDGYMEREVVPWYRLQPALAAVLTSQTGGFSHGDVVGVDGKPMRVVTGVWGRSGPPIAYKVVPTIPTILGRDMVRVDAAEVEAHAFI